jgi:hypothetical protein
VHDANVETSDIPTDVVATCSTAIGADIITMIYEYKTCVMSGFRRDVAEISVLLGYYVMLSGSFVPTFRDNLSVPSSRVKKSKASSWTS